MAVTWKKLAFATDCVTHALATAANDFLVATGSGAYVKKTLAETLTILGKAAASGLASLNASTKVVEQPASITDHLEGTPTEDLATKAPTSEWAYDHVAGADPHTGYRLESANHNHRSAGAQAGKLDHGLALSGLTHDDHTQYIKHSLATAVSDFLAASRAGVYIKKTLAETLTILGKAAASGLASLNASTKVVEQPASITDHLEGTPTEDLATKAPTSEWAFDHGADVDAHHARSHDHSLVADNDLLNPMAIYRVDNGCLRVLNPKGGAYYHSAYMTGLTRIKLPTWHTGNLTLRGTITTLIEDATLTFVLSGRTETSYPAWRFTSARISGTTPRQIKVRFARNAANNKWYILIGETTDYLRYYYIAITSVTVGYGQAIADYKEGWEISIVNNLTGYNIDRTITDAVRIGKSHLEWTAAKLLLGAGDATDPTEIDPVVVSSGSYTGNNTANRTIPHGLGIAPKLVVLVRSAGVFIFNIIQGSAAIYWTDASSPGSGNHAVTAPDATNFHVGNAASYAQSANGNSEVYYWVAIG